MRPILLFHQSNALPIQASFTWNWVHLNIVDKLLLIVALLNAVRRFILAHFESFRKGHLRVVVRLNGTLAVASSFVATIILYVCIRSVSIVLILLRDQRMMV